MKFDQHTSLPMIIRIEFKASTDGYASTGAQIEIEVDFHLAEAYPY